MRRTLRFMIVLGVFVGLIWASASIEYRGKTPFGHGLVWWQKQNFFAEMVKEPKKNTPPKKKDTARPAISAPAAPAV